MLEYSILQFRPYLFIRGQLDEIKTKRVISHAAGWVIEHTKDTLRILICSINDENMIFVINTKDIIWIRQLQGPKDCPF